MPTKLPTWAGTGLFALVLCQNALWAQKTLNDDASIGVPTLFEYTDDGVDLGRAESLTLAGSSTLADLGIALDADLVHFYQGVASGGREQHFRYGGHGDYLLNVDGSKRCGKEGLFLQIRAEHRFGQDINASTGALMPASILMALPLDWLDVTTDMQFVEPAVRRGAKTALMAETRVNVEF